MGLRIYILRTTQALIGVSSATVVHRGPEWGDSVAAAPTAMSSRSAKDGPWISVTAALEYITAHLT